MRRALIAAAAAAALSVPLGAAGPASADGTVTVSGLAFPDSTSTYLTYFGCEDLYHADSRAPQVRIDRGGAPAGDRSFALLMPGSQTAAGPVHKVASVGDTTVAGLYARGGSTGAAYVWYVTDDLDPGQVWAGRAGLSAPSGWGYVNTAAASYDWQLLDAATGDEVSDGGSATIGDFTDDHGDGPGYLLSGFGCDGGEFSVDALRYGSRGAVTTYDLEGITTAATMESKPTEVKPGTPVKISGSTRDTLERPVGAAMVLQAKPAGADGFRNVGGPVSASTDGLVHTVVTPKVTTTYRWFVPEEGYTSSSTSSTVRVVVTVGSDPSTDPPTSESSDPPSGQGGSDGGGGSAGSDGSEVEVPPLPTQSPSPSPTETPGAEPSDSPSAEPDEPTDPATTDAPEPDPGEATDATP